ncbi:MAG: hypothetical protein QM790_16025 [Nibricoccus sp.]
MDSTTLYKLLSQSQNHYRHFCEANADTPSPNVIDSLCKSWRIFLIVDMLQDPSDARFNETSGKPPAFEDEVRLFACLPRTEAFKALAAYMVFSKWPGEATSNHQFHEEFSRTIAAPLSLLKAGDLDSLDELYARFNPSRADERPFEKKFGKCAVGAA